MMAISHNTGKRFLALLLTFCLLAFTGCSGSASTSSSASSSSNSAERATTASSMASVSSSSAASESNGNANTGSLLSELVDLPDGYEVYSELDSLGRCGVAIAKVGAETIPTQKRGDISKVKPTGWNQAFYKGLISASNGALYNRCHLIAHSLAAEDANELNLITGTRQMNEAMIPYEKQILDYVESKGGHVVYRVTPDFQGNELVARGVRMEAFSVEDNGAAVNFDVYLPNVQDGVDINYATGASSLVGNTGEDEALANTGSTESGYVLNTNTMKFHSSNCSSAKSIKDKNRAESNASRDELISQGYKPCGICKP